MNRMSCAMLRWIVFVAVLTFLFGAVHPALARNVTAKLDEAYAMTKRIIDRHRAAVDRIADLLLERETVGGAETAAIVGTGVAGAPGSGRRA